MYSTMYITAFILRQPIVKYDWNYRVGKTIDNKHPNIESPEVMITHYRVNMLNCGTTKMGRKLKKILEIEKEIKVLKSKCECDNENLTITVHC